MPDIFNTLLDYYNIIYYYKHRRITPYLFTLENLYIRVYIIYIYISVRNIFEQKKTTPSLIH